MIKLFIIIYLFIYCAHVDTSAAKKDKNIYNYFLFIYCAHVDTSAAKKDKNREKKQKKKKKNYI